MKTHFTFTLLYIISYYSVSDDEFFFFYYYYHLFLFLPRRRSFAVNRHLFLAVSGWREYRAAAAD